MCILLIYCVCLWAAGQVRAAGVTSPTLLTSLQQVSAAAGLSASAAATPMSTIRLTMPQQTRQRSPASAGTAAATPQMPAQVLKVMGSQPGSIPQIITLSSPRAVCTDCRHVEPIHSNNNYIHCPNSQKSQVCF